MMHKRTAAKASYEVLLCHMEQGEVTGYDQVDRIDCIRRVNAQKHAVSNPHASVTSTNATKNTMRTSRTMPCQFFIRYLLHIVLHVKKLRVCCTSMCVPFALLLQLRLSHILI